VLAGWDASGASQEGNAVHRLTLAVAAVLVALACGPVLAGDGEARVYLGRATSGGRQPEAK
jgi:hypothetical protein